MEQGFKGDFSDDAGNLLDLHPRHIKRKRSNSGVYIRQAIRIQPGYFIRIPNPAFNPFFHLVHDFERLGRQGVMWDRTHHRIPRHVPVETDNSVRTLGQQVIKIHIVCIGSGLSVIRTIGIVQNLTSKNGLDLLDVHHEVCNRQTVELVRDDIRRSSDERDPVHFLDVQQPRSGARISAGCQRYFQQFRNVVTVTVYTDVAFRDPEHPHRLIIRPIQRFLLIVQIPAGQPFFGLYVVIARQAVYQFFVVTFLNQIRVRLAGALINKLAVLRIRAARIPVDSEFFRRDRFDDDLGFRADRLEDDVMPFLG